MSDTELVRHVAEADFATDVVAASHTTPVVVDFWAPWCGPCRQLSPLLERVAARHAPDVRTVKVNVDEAPTVARTYRVQGIPAVMAFRDGAVVASFVGVQPESAVEQLFTGLAPTPADRAVVTAALTSDVAEREALLRDALAGEPDHAGALVALAQLLADRGETDDGLRLLERAPADDAARRLAAQLRLRAGGTDDAELESLRADAGHPEGALRLGRALAARGDYDEALPLLVAAVASPDTREEARAATLEVFALLGNDDARVVAWRPKLAAALF
jgi:putative thioredoxin